MNKIADTQSIKQGCGDCSTKQVIFFPSNNAKMRETALLPIAQEFYLLMLFLFWFLGISLKMLDLKISGENKSLVWSECFSGSVFPPAFS